jgi:ubiquinone/menaquinone biosynthesis C-methylase UbiE
VSGVDVRGLGERVFAWYYPRILEVAERAGQRETRRRLLSSASGRALEIGAGTGVNLPHYTPSVSELVISEPSPHMLARLRRTVAGEPPAAGHWELVRAGAEDLPFEDGSFHTVVCTYVLCTVPDPRRALNEIARVLAPGGRYLFMEHVRAEEGTRLGRFQDVVEPVHTVVAAGCHPNRRTEALIAGSPMVVERIERGRQPRAPITVRPTIIGTAVKG